MLHHKSPNYTLVKNGYIFIHRYVYVINLRICPVKSFPFRSTILRLVINIFTICIRIMSTEQFKFHIFCVARLCLLFPGAKIFFFI